jgi:hypothetical protein
MEVWIKQREDISDLEVNVTVWTSEQDALKSTCQEIMKKIGSDWDMDEEHMSTTADSIEAEIHGKGYRAAMDLWNDFQSNYNDDYAEYFSVYKRSVLPDDGEVVTSASVLAYKATTTGATCRGPCGQYNDYAYADRSDGTHVCFQCSTFQHIFGTKP